MGKVLTAITLLIVGGLTIAGGVLMHKFFGLVGVGLLAAFLLPIVGIVLYLGGGIGGGGTSQKSGRRRQSKGAQTGRDR